MYKLYYFKGACSLAVHVVLNEVGAKCELINGKNPDGSKSDALLEVNPRGAVPVLKIDDVILREGVAILMYLLENHHNSLLPKEGIARAKALEWLCFANATLHPAYSRLFFLHRAFGDKADESELYPIAIAAVQKYWDEIEERLKNEEYLCGKNVTVADILVTVIANWSPMFKTPINFGAKTKEYFSKIIARPSFASALVSEGVEYKVNK